jgi:hypothetical protein
MFQVSIHEGLTEALSTSLAPDLSSIYHLGSNPPQSIQDAASVRSMSPAPSTRRAQSPTPSGRTIPVVSSSPATGSSLYPIKSAEPPSGGSAKRNQGNRSSWTSGLWVWSNGSKPKSTRPRKGSVGSVLSNVGTLGDVAESGTGETDTADEEDAWRKGDGGSSPGYRAIFLATVCWSYPEEFVIRADVVALDHARPAIYPRVSRYTFHIPYRLPSAFAGIDGTRQQHHHQGTTRTPPCQHINFHTQ